MNPEPEDRSQQDELIHALTALVAALDQRVPHIERAGERQIALDAAALRAEAVERLASLQASAALRGR
jgi:hypothetical protein